MLIGVKSWRGERERNRDVGREGEAEGVESVRERERETQGEDSFVCTGKSPRTTRAHL